ncbi:hypothetical protein O3I_012880 [Nocardia brasiliensis ATCC 700358]|uniref:Neurotransmitter-gated ion-channel ligand-binding domain-containing protein n=1 Tax=Nocardia brasiliensis (strain ATCC 700358 / HUJEG-1) TaxID=1133849 RepID=K0ESS6_NOCB7|nr:hypothetical protein O3I_012880 [Nocardia brasiliensis ATCC 700358]
MSEYRSIGYWRANLQAVPIRDAVSGLVSKWKLLLWLAATAVSLLLAAGTVYSWTHAASKHAPVAEIGTTVSSYAEAEAAVRPNLPQDRHVPRLSTGVLVNSLQFVNAHNVKAVGHIWQHIPADFPAEIEIGVQLLEAEDPHSPKKVFEYPLGDWRVVVWSFSTVIRQQFHYQDYPLDHQDIWLRMRPVDMIHQVQLVPSFESFPPWDPHALNGLDPGLVFGDWEPEYTVWSLNHQAYSMLTHPGLANTDELYFNVGVTRGLLGPLLGRIVPVLLLAVLMFLSLFVITTDPDRRPISGFTAFAIITFSVSTVLVVAVNDNAARTEVGSAGISYIEYWYFTLYVMTLLVALNATLLLHGTFGKALAWRDNLLPKVLFWPLFTAIMFAATVGYLGI